VSTEIPVLHSSASTLMVIFIPVSQMQEQGGIKAPPPSPLGRGFFFAAKKQPRRAEPGLFFCEPYVNPNKNGFQRKG